MPSGRLNVPDLPPSQPKPFKPDGPRAAPLSGSLLEKISRWEVALSDYPESDFVEMVLSIIRNGATLGAPFALPRSYTPPYQTGPAEAFFLREEIISRQGGASGPNVPCHSSPASPLLQWVPKDRVKLRAIHGCVFTMFTYHHSLALCITHPSLTSFRALSVAPIGCHLGKIDLANAFRHIRLWPGAQLQAGFKLESVTYRDFCMPLIFESRAAPFIFNLIAEAFYWIL